MAHTDLADLVADAAQQAPERDAVVDLDGRSITWAQLEDRVARFAAGLGSVGIVAGRRVLICLPNRLEFVVAWLGVLRAQAIAVPVNPRARVDELEWMLTDSGARVAIGDATTIDSLRAAAATLAQEPGPGLTIRVVLDATPQPDEVTFEAVQAAEPTVIPPLPDPEKPAALLYPGGASDEGRAAILSHRALVANLEQLRGLDLVGPDDVVLGVLPLFHIYGLNAVLGSVLARQATLVLAGAFDADHTLELIGRERITVVPVAPAAVDRWLSRADLAERLGGVRLVFSGSAPLSGETVQRFREVSGLELHQGYGLTEAAPVVTSTLAQPDVPPGSVGTPLPGVEVRLIGLDGRNIEPDDPGEIQIRGDNLFSGYWPDGADGPAGDGWWSTGDIGVLSPQDQLSLADPVAELVVVSGFNVYPREVESVVSAVDGVRAAGVIGVPDEDTGQAVVAYVVAPGRDPAEIVRAVASHSAAHLARFKVPARIEVVDQLPISSTGRVQRGRLRMWERRGGLGLLE